MNFAATPSLPNCFARAPSAGTCPSRAQNGYARLATRSRVGGNESDLSSARLVSRAVAIHGYEELQWDYDGATGPNPQLKYFMSFSNQAESRFAGRCFDLRFDDTSSGPMKRNVTLGTLPTSHRIASVALCHGCCFSSG